MIIFYSTVTIISKTSLVLRHIIIDMFNNIFFKIDVKEINLIFVLLINIHLYEILSSFCMAVLNSLVFLVYNSLFMFFENLDIITAWSIITCHKKRLEIFSICKKWYYKFNYFQTQYHLTFVTNMYFNFSHICHTSVEWPIMASHLTSFLTSLTLNIDLQLPISILNRWNNLTTIRFYKIFNF